jgi:hypothetical protein
MSLQGGSDLLQLVKIAIRRLLTQDRFGEEKAGFESDE